MENNQKDSTFLARWLEGELSPEELQAFEKSEDYPIYKRINDLSQTLETPVFEKRDSFDKLFNELTKAKPKTIKLVTKLAYAAAASIVILLGIFSLKNQELNYNTGFGEMQVVELPDASKVHLNANSSLFFNEKDWQNNRILEFSGEAFFDVEKGSLFKVLSDEGIVQVLGTEFNVTSRNGYLEVLCNEGKVKVYDSINKELILLTAGEAFRLVNGKQETWDIKQDKPTWLKGESSFVKTPLKQVIKSLEDQYNVVFDTQKVNVSVTFTGSYTHKDLSLALKTVFKPLNISYTKKGKTIFLTLRK